MIETDQNQICSPLYNLFKPYLLGVVFPSIVLTSFLGLGFYPTLFTIPILVFSTIFLVTFTSKRKLALEENPTASKKPIEDGVEVIERSDAAQEADVGIVKEFQVEPSQYLASDSEESSDDSSNNMQQNLDETSDDSASEEEDEEGLIEIAIPSSDHCPGLSHDVPKVTNDLQSNILPTLLPESIFNQQDFVELLAELNEVNEEENLIEIDISMGSIKCPRFEIEA